MNIYSFTGVAGTGKTTSLFAKLVEVFKTVEMTDKNLLVLTFMHGARKRLTRKLKENSITCKVLCTTIDSFALSIVRRFRNYVGFNYIIDIDIDNDFSEKCKIDDSYAIMGINFTRELFIKLLDFEIVNKFLRTFYPIIIIDEFQDCKGKLLELIIKLSNCGSTILLAADDFQSLDSDLNSEAVTWLKEGKNHIELTKIFRTSESKIINSALALRNNEKLKNCIPVKKVVNEHLAKSIIFYNIVAKKWGHKGNVVIIYPTGYDSSLFVKKVLLNLGNPLKSGKLGNRGYPFKIEEVGSPGDTISFINQYTGKEINNNELKFLATNANPIIRLASQKLLRSNKLKGKENITFEQFNEFVNREIHTFKSYQNPKLENFIAMTVHGAKNREFDYVFILWPYEIPSNELYQRKLLYNAITRSKKDAVIIVQAKDTSKLSSVLTLLDN